MHNLSWFSYSFELIIQAFLRSKIVLGGSSVHVHYYLLGPFALLVEGTMQRFHEIVEFWLFFWVV